jgi:hypothetical protein
MNTHARAVTNVERCRIFDITPPLLFKMINSEADARQNNSGAREGEMPASFHFRRIGGQPLAEAPARLLLPLAQVWAKNFQKRRFLAQKEALHIE